MVESTLKTFPHMQFLMLYTMVMPKMPKYALKRSFFNVFLLNFVVVVVFTILIFLMFTSFLKVVQVFIFTM